MSTTNQKLETPEQYHERLTASCPMALEHWRALKGVFYSLLIAGLMVYAVERGADWRVFVSTVIVIGIVTTVEIKEVQILDKLSITFFRDRRREDEGKE